MDSRPSPTPGPAAESRQFRTFPPSPRNGTVRPFPTFSRAYEIDPPAPEFQKGG